MKKTLIIIAGVIAFILLALILVPKFVNWNGYKPKIAAIIKESTGRELSINGDIRLSIFPNINFSVSDIHISNAEGMTETDMLSIDAVSGKLRLFPLITSKIVIDTLVISKPLVNLEVDKNGKTNWDSLKRKASSGRAKGIASGGEKGLPINGLTLGDVRIEQGNISFMNAATGQTIKAKDIDLKVALADISSPLTLRIQTKLNNEPLSVDLSVKSPINIIDGTPLTINSTVNSKFINASYEGSIKQKPVLAFNGTMDINIPSVGKLSAWLGQPLKESQPDPGQLQARAVFKGEGAKVTLTKATIEGDGLKASATGSFDKSGNIAKVVLNVESDSLDFNRYLPTVPVGKKKTFVNKKKHTSDENITSRFSQEPINFSALKKIEADVSLSIGGIKALDFETGRITFKTNLKDGLLLANLSVIDLYSGNIKGTFRLDGSGDMPGIDANIKIDKVKVDKLAKAATGGKTPVTGIVSGKLNVKTFGVSPRKLVEGLKARLLLELGGVDIKDAPVGSISEVRVDLNLPGLENPPKLKSWVVYNKRRINLDLSTDPFKKILAGEPVVLKAFVASELVNLSYKGEIQQKPVPGFDGAFNLDVPSIGKLASWIGQPLKKSQPDPGPLTVRVLFKGDGDKINLKEAIIEGKALKAKATGSFDKSGAVPKVVINILSETLDIDHYLPPPARKKKTAAKRKKSPTSDGPIASIPDKPFELGGLKKIDADVNIVINGIKARGYKIGRVDFATNLKNGLLTTDLKELGLYGGNVNGAFKIDGSGKTLGVYVALKIAGVNLDDLSKTTIDGKITGTGTASGNFNIAGRGANPRSLIESLKGKAVLNLEGVDVKKTNVGPISEVNINLNLPGVQGKSSLKGSMVYNNEKTNLDFQFASIKKVLSGKPFALKAAIDSKLLNINHNGTVRLKPVPGLEGTLNLNVPSIAQLAKWLDKPLGLKQPDPGALNVRAAFSVEGPKTTLKKVTIDGKAIKASATGIFDKGGDVPVLTAMLNVEDANLNAYLAPPKPKKDRRKKKKVAKREPGGWSEEPIDFSPLSKANADIKINIGSLVYRELTIKPGRIKAVLKNGILNAAIEELKLPDGIIKGFVNLDASGKAADADYKFSISVLDAKPLLKTLSGKDSLSGKLDFQTTGTLTGGNQKELMSSLNGNGQLKFLDGVIHGVNIASKLRKAKTLGFRKEAVEETEKTDFSEISGSFVIKNGVMENHDLKILSSLVRLSGEGLVSLRERTIDYALTAKLGKSPKGGGEQDTLAGLPIPIKFKGPWDNVSRKIDLKSVLTDTERPSPKKFLKGLFNR